MSNSVLDSYISRYVIEHGKLPKEMVNGELDKWARNIIGEIDVKTENESYLRKKYVRLIVDYLQIMDTYLPDWRYYAKEEIKTLKELLNKQMYGVK